VANVMAFICEIFVFEYLGLQVGLINRKSIDVGIIISGTDFFELDQGLMRRFRYPLVHIVQGSQYFSSGKAV